MYFVEFGYIFGDITYEMGMHNNGDGEMVKMCDQRFSIGAAGFVPFFFCTFSEEMNAPLNAFHIEHESGYLGT